MVNTKEIPLRGRRLVRGASAVYHVVNRVAFSQMVLDEEAKSVFVKVLRRQASFAGIEILAYCVMTNHFHILVRVPAPSEVGDAELLRRYRLLYRDHRPFSAPDADVLEQLLRADGQKADAWRKRLLARMHHLSPFMAELKQRFSIWYNKNRNNRGTVWSERFRSIIIQDAPEYTAPAAAYIDLNPVRAKMVDDPREYGFSSYGNAMRGDQAAQESLVALFHQERSWNEAVRSYRILLFGKGSKSKGIETKDTGVIDADRAMAVIERGGKLSWSEYLRMRIGYFTHGRILGSAAFVENMTKTLDRAEKRVETITRKVTTLQGLDGSMCALKRISRGIG